MKDLGTGTVAARPMTREAADLQRKLSADQGGRTCVIADADGNERAVFPVDAREILRAHPDHHLVSGNPGS